MINLHLTERSDNDNNNNDNERKEEKCSEKVEQTFVAA